MNITKALVVDDSKVAHLTLRKMLMERDIEVDWVGSGEESVDYLKSQQPDIVFMDVMMPGMDGFETLRAINEDSAIERQTIVMCSANATDEDKTAANENGAIDFLTKPYTSHELDSILDRIRNLRPVNEAVNEAATETADETATAEAAAANEDLDLGEALSLHFDEDADDAAQADNVLPLAPAAPSVATTVSADQLARVEAKAGEAAKTTAESVSRKAAQVTLKAAKTAAVKAAKEAVEAALKNRQGAGGAAVDGDRDLDGLRAELHESLEQQFGERIRAIVQEAVQANMQEAVSAVVTSDAFSEQLAFAVESEIATFETKFRQVTNDVVDEKLTEDYDDSGDRALGRANAAMTFAVLALLMSLGIVGTAAAFLFDLFSPYRHRFYNRGHKKRPAWTDRRVVFIDGPRLLSPADPTG